MIEIHSRSPDAQLAHRDGPCDLVWLHDGLPEDLARKAPPLLSVDGGYLFLLELSNGGLMLCASNKPATYAQNVVHRLVPFEVTMSRIAVSKPCGYYLKVKRRLMKRLSDLPKVGQMFKDVELETLKAWMEPQLHEALQAHPYPLTGAGGTAGLPLSVGAASRRAGTL